jgi:hypothetical protein
MAELEERDNVLKSVNGNRHTLNDETSVFNDAVSTTLSCFRSARFDVARQVAASHDAASAQQRLRVQALEHRARQLDERVTLPPLQFDIGGNVVCLIKSIV